MTNKIYILFHLLSVVDTCLCNATSVLRDGSVQCRIKLTRPGRNLMWGNIISV